MRIAVLLIMSLACGTALSATVYKWVDENGVTHYSDQPHPGAKKLEVESAQTYSAPPPPQQPTTQKAVAEGPVYGACEIARPTPDEVLFNVNTVTARLRLDPDLRPGDKATIALDGKRMPEVAVTNGAFTLTSVYRGTHTILAEVQDFNGVVVCTTPPVTFHVRQASTQSPRSPTKPPVKPPPKAPAPPKRP